MSWLEKAITTPRRSAAVPHRVTAHVLERQDGDGRLVGQRKGFRGELARRFCGCHSRMSHGIEPHWQVNILERFFAEVVKRKSSLAPDLIKGAAGKTYSARLAFALNPRRD